MKKILAFILIALAATALFAEDITATTMEGRTVILHDNGTWNYISSPGINRGKKYIGTYSIEFVDVAEDLMKEALAEMGLEEGSLEYTMYMEMMEEEYEEEVEEETLSLCLYDDGTISILEYGYEDMEEYTVDPVTRVLTIYFYGYPMEYGTFSSDYRSLALMDYSGLTLDRID